MKITVVITAYNRNEYLDCSLGSLANQSNKNFDVILITNFNYDLSKFKTLSIVHIIMNGTLGDFIYTAIENCKGDIILFLDDDDFFAEDKIEVVSQLFKPNIGYIHNKALYFSAKGITHRNNTTVDFNSSSISIRRRILEKYIRILPTVSAGIDTFIYLTAVESDYNIINFRKTLTYYRKYENNVSSISNMDWLHLYQQNLLLFTKHFKSLKAQKHIKTLLLFTKFAIFTRSENKMTPNFKDWIYFFYYGLLNKQITLMIKSIRKLVH